MSAHLQTSSNTRRASAEKSSTGVLSSDGAVDLSPRLIDEPARPSSPLPELSNGESPRRAEADGPPDNAPEVSVRTFTSILLYFERQYGATRLEKLWQERQISLPLEYLRNATNFVSLEFLERFVDLLMHESGDTGFMRKAGMFTAKPEAIGFIYHAVKAFGSPRICYEKLIEYAATYNRVSKFQIEEIDNNRLILRHTGQKREWNRNICELRMGQFASFPTIWGLPPAQVYETQCQVAGADCCRYQLRWNNPVRAWRRFAGVLVGAVAGVALGLLGVAPAALTAIGCSLLGGFLGAWLDMRHDLRLKEEYLAFQNQGMIDSMRDLQQRYEEVYKTNIELERRVAERTYELSDANTRLVESNEKLEESLQKQRELDRLKTQFFDNVSHELRTPLTLILLSLESVLRNNRSDVPGWLPPHLETVDRSAKRLLRLINHLLDLAKIEAGKTRLRYESIEMDEFLKSVLLPFRVVAEQRNIRLSLDASSSAAILADADKLDIVFQNLVSNALKFTSEGGSVTVRLRANSAQVVVEIEDTGIGMAPGDLTVIFDRFAQADSSGIRRFGGTGIGLALVKETVELHGGSISVTSQPGTGSCFVVSLPKGTAHVREELRERRGDDVPVIRERREIYGDPLTSLRPKLATDGGGEEDWEARTTTEALDHKVLVVEDDPAMRRFLVNILRQQYRVVEATNGQEGRAKALSEHPDLVLSDVVMPVMSGLQLTRALKELADTADIPVILLTARGEAESAADGLSSGANDYVAKPFSPRELLARIETQLRLRDAALKLAENERLAALGLLTSGFAHEIRNPLNGLLNALAPIRKSMENTSGASTAEGLLQIVEECGQRIRHLSESLLSFARPSDGPVPVDVPASLETTLKVLGWRMSSGIAVQRDYQCHDVVWGDPAALNEVWLNLLDNALRAMGDTGRLSVATRKVQNEMLVSISDSGVGIPPERIGQIFEPFFSTRQAGEGTGLGLALCRRIILRHRGRITASSEPGVGSRFEVALPLHVSGSKVVPIDSVVPSSANGASPWAADTPSELDTA